MTADPELPRGFYELVGRIAQEAAVLEEQLLAVVAQIETRAHSREDPEFLEHLHAALETHGGKPGTQLAREIRNQADVLLRDADRAPFSQFIDDVLAALERRHQLVHSVWSATHNGGAIGFRSLPKRKRGLDSGPVDFVELTEEDLRDLLDHIRQLVQQVGVWLNRFAPFTEPTPTPEPLRADDTSVDWLRGKG